MSAGRPEAPVRDTVKVSAISAILSSASAMLMLWVEPPSDPAGTITDPEVGL